MYALLYRLVHGVSIPESPFSARIVAEGRVLMELEDGEWWCHGVEPGGITAEGKDPDAAFKAFRTAFQRVLAELVEEASTFAEFQKAVQGLFSVDEIEASRWSEAHAHLRAGDVPEAPFDSLPRRPFTESFVSVERVQGPAFEEMTTSLPIAA